MSDQSPMPGANLPENPDLLHLKNQARDLKRSGVVERLSEAQYRVARKYGFASWPKLKAYVDATTRVGELKAAIDANDLEAVKRLMTRHPDLHRAPLGYNKNGPLTWVAECRVPRVAPSEARLDMARWMIENGSDIHQGGDGPLMRAALDDDRIPMMELLVRYGADVNARWNGSYPILCAPCETLAPRSLRWLLDHGADPYVQSEPYGSPLSMVIGAYARPAERKHACLEVFNDTGFVLPDTPAMAFHRGRADRLESFIDRDPALLSHRFSIAEIFPPDLGLPPEGGFHLAPIEGATLLHLAVEFDEQEIMEMLLRRGADVNARADIDADGFGGHTPLFHAVLSLFDLAGTKARLLLQHGADPNARATLRKQLSNMNTPEQEQLREFHDVTAIGYARQFVEPAWVGEEAVRAIAAAGGAE